MKRSHDPRLWWGVAGLAAVATLLATLLPVRDWGEALEQSLVYHSLAVSMLIFCAASVVGTLLMLPAWIFPLAAGAAFGFWWGSVAAIASSAMTALTAFLIGRYVLRERIERIARRDKTFRAVDKACKREPMKIVFLLRMSPVLPSGFKSYFLGLTCVETVQYLLASVLGMLPGTLLKVWVGHAGRDALTHGGALKWGLLGLGIACTVGVAVIVGRLARKSIGV